MEIITSIVLGLATYAYLETPSKEEVSQTQPYVNYIVKEEQPNVQWVFING